MSQEATREDDERGWSRWGVLASGEGGGRITSRFFVQSENPGIDDRILILNTNRADIRNTIRYIENNLGSIQEEDIGANFAMEFGSVQGAGNRPTTGEQCAREDIERIAERLHNQFGARTDAIFHITTLGGGTGNGSIPYFIEHFNGGLENPEWSWMTDATHAVLGVWPYHYEPSQRHFNAIYGLSRLLRTREGTKNAGVVLLASNAKLSEGEDADDDYEPVNKRLVQAIEHLISAGRETNGVIDVQDLVAIPAEIGAYHFTPGVAEGLDANVYKLDYMFDKAAENTFVPLDVNTARAAYVVVRAPENVIQRDDNNITETNVKRAFEEWKSRNGMTGAPGMSTLAPKRERGNDVDVLLILGGFDLDPLLEHSWEKYDAYKDNIQSGRAIAASEQISVDEIQSAERNLEEYLELTGG